MSPYQLIANAIVAQAADDYKECLKVLRDKPKELDSMTEVFEKEKQNGISAEEEKERQKGIEAIKGSILDAEICKYDVEKFCRSDWYQSLTDIDPNYILKEISRKVAIA